MADTPSLSPELVFLTDRALDAAYAEAEAALHIAAAMLDVGPEPMARLEATARVFRGVREERLARVCERIREGRYAE